MNSSVRDALVQGYGKVIGHYRQVLQGQNILEPQAIHTRVMRVESEPEARNRPTIVPD